MEVYTKAFVRCLTVVVHAVDAAVAYAAVMTAEAMVSALSHGGRA
jgi:hypothetical protein